MKPVKDKMRDDNDLKECARLLEALLRDLPAVAKRAHDNPDDAAAQQVCAPSALSLVLCVR